MTNLLLDTHIVLWWLADSVKLSNKLKVNIREASTVFVSSVTAWEISVKKSLGKLQAPDNFEKAVLESGFKSLPLLFSHAEALLHLPFHHEDPFDRMLIAQAKTEELIFVTHDKTIKRYEIEVMLG